MTTLFGNTAGRSRRDGPHEGDPERQDRSWAVPVLALLCAAIVGTVAFCTYELAAAAHGDDVQSLRLPFYLAAACFLAAAATVVVLQSIRVAQRVSGPERRLIESLRRIRAGDLAFRIHLRKGDLLKDLACECNALIDWMNANPPVGALTGSDVFEVENVELEVEGARP